MYCMWHLLTACHPSHLWVQEQKPEYYRLAKVGAGWMLETVATTLSLRLLALLVSHTPAGRCLHVLLS